MTSSPTPTAAACQASLPVFTPSFIPYPSLSPCPSLSGDEVRAGLLSPKLQIGAIMAEVPKTSPQYNKPLHLHHLFSLLTCFCRVCLPDYTSQESLITNLCLESTATHRAAHKTKRIHAHLAPYALCLSLVVNH